MIEFVPQTNGLPSYLQMGPSDADYLYLLLHGFPDSARVWEPLMRALPQSALKIAPFAPGTDGIRPESKQTFGAIAQRDRILRLLEYVRPGVARESVTRNIVLVGHDLGGGLVSPLQEKLATSIRCAVYINSMRLQQFYKRKGRIGQAVRSSYMLIFQLPFLNRTTLAPVSKTLINTIYSHGGLQKDDSLRKEGKDVLWGIEQYRQYAKDLLRLIGREVRQENIPTLFLYGERDPYIRPATKDELARFHTRFELKVLEAGHWPQRTHVEEVSRSILQFVATCELKQHEDASDSKSA